jgi:lipopolysaccharide transport system ATP-binding protein
MSDIAIRGKNLGKRYRLGQREPYKTLRDVVTEAFTAPFRRWRKQNLPISQSPFRDPKSDHIWALKDVSFEIKQGEVVGVIGRNGAGKSTLLKILSRTTEPTEGYVEIYGRIGSLLEVGTGFSPELTGRENIYLNAAILGMKRREIDRKFDEIVAFAEIEKFLDTPVKRYSSGMYVRLAFAVAAHLEPEILLVDEVLAVGDAAFQKKCLGKMGEVAKGGRTVLFVSHNLRAIERLCSASILLNQGRITHTGPTLGVINTYLGFTSRLIAEWKRAANLPWSGDIAFQSVRTIDSGKQPVGLFSGDQPIGIEIEYVVLRPLPACQIGVRINNQEGVTIMYTAEHDQYNVASMRKEPGRYRCYFEIPGRFLPPGNYSLFVAAHAPMQKIFEVLEDIVTFNVSEAGSLAVLDGRLGFLTPSIPWQVTHMQLA